MIQDKNAQELSGKISPRTSGIFSTFHLPGFMGRWGAWIVLLASLLITFNAWYFVSGEATKRVQARFDFRVKTIEKGIYERLQAYEFLLRGGSGLFEASDEVTREEWRTYVTKLQINQYYPGIQGVGFSKQILPSEKEAHLRQIRGEGFPQYTIKPEGDRSEYTSIIFLEPFDWRNQRAFGYDMFSEPTRKEAMIRARDTGMAALSGKVTLVQETANDIQAGFLIYLAVYRKGEPLETPEQRYEALIGYVYSPFRMNEFMKGILVENEGYVYLQIFDGEKPLKETQLYKSDITEGPHNHNDGHHFATAQSILTYAGHRWLLSFVSSKYFEENIETSSMNFILLLGITISLLLFGMVFSLTKSRSQAIALANTTLDLEKANIELREEITERKQTEKKLLESEDQFKRIIQNNSDAIVVTVNGIIRLANPAAEKIFGQSALELVGKDFGFPVLGKESVDIQILHPSGEQVTATMRTVQIEWEKTLAYLISLHDITQRLKMEEKQKKLEQQLVQAQKMESVGRLAGGVAHDYNNALTTIIGFTELAMRDAEPEGTLHDDLNQVLKAGRRARDITRQLLAFARKQTIAPVVLKLNPTVESMLKMLGRLIGEDIDLVWLPGKNLWNVLMDPSQIDQILANLCVNARDAIEGVGKITIETNTVVFDAAYCADHAGFIPGEFVLLAVSDNGCGMDKETLDTIFEPFFTTKDVGKGTGLGLSMVYGIVKQNNGFINVYSEPGKGTSIKIYLSRHEGKTVEIQGENTEEVPQGCGETILVVEDDLPILKLAQKILEGLNYTVFIADTPNGAISLAKELTDKIHLLITDVIMPEMNGRELSEHLQSLFPDLKCIFMSGYTANAIAHHGVLDEGVYFIQKPFSKRDLATIARKVLNKKS